LGVRAGDEEVNLDRESVCQILSKELNMRMVCAKMIPKLLHQDNAPAQNALSLNQCLANKISLCLSTLSNRPLRLLPVPKDQVSAQRNPVCVGEKCKSKNDRCPQQPYKTDLQNFFEDWQHHLQLCVNSEENYFTGNRSRFPEFFN
jgi:hypothetical protein